MSTIEKQAARVPELVAKLSEVRKRHEVAMRAIWTYRAKLREHGIPLPLVPPEANAQIYEEWLRFGVRHGWISGSWCYVHDAPPLTDDEEGEIEANDGDPDVICIPVVRLLT